MNIFSGAPGESRSLDKCGESARRRQLGEPKAGVDDGRALLSTAKFERLEEELRLVLHLRTTAASPPVRGRPPQRQRGFSC